MTRWRETRESARGDDGSNLESRISNLESRRSAVLRLSSGCSRGRILATREFNFVVIRLAMTVYFAFRHSILTMPFSFLSIPVVLGRSYRPWSVRVLFSIHLVEINHSNKSWVPFCE